MLKIIMSLGLLLSVSLFATLVDDGWDEYIKGNKKQAGKLWTKACDSGDIDGCSTLGVLYYNGDGVMQDKRKAKNLYAKACDGGHIGGCYGYKKLNEAGIK